MVEQDTVTVCRYCGREVVPQFRTGIPIANRYEHAVQTYTCDLYLDSNPELSPDRREVLTVPREAFDAVESEHQIPPGKVRAARRLYKQIHSPIRLRVALLAITVAGVGGAAAWLDSHGYELATSLETDQ